MPADLHRDASFIVRVWWERHIDAGPLWRGQVVHAPTGQSRYFDQLEDLLTFIEQWAGRLRETTIGQAFPGELGGESLNDSH